MNVELKTSDAELLRTYLRKSGDSLTREQAFRRIVDRYAGLVFAVSFRVVNGDRQLAEDCVQATFIVLARKASSVRKPGMLSAWLHGTAKRIATTHVDREAKRRKREQQSMELQEQNQRDAENRTTEFVLDNLNILSGKLQSVLILHYLEGYSYAETADILECSVDAVGKRIERAVAKLRRCNRRSGQPWGKIGTASLVAPALSPAIHETCAALGSSAGLKTAAVSAASTQFAVGAITVMKTKTISIVAAGLVVTALMSASIVIHAGNKSTRGTADAPAGKQATKPKLDPTLTFVSVGGEKYTMKKLGELYLKSGKVLSGRLADSAPVVGGVPQTYFRYENVDQIKGGLSGFGKWTFAVYDIGLGDLSKQIKGKAYVTFLTVDYGKELASFESSKKLLAVLRSWKKFGVLSPEEFLANARTAGWIIKARCTGDRCMESYPCQHSWAIDVQSKLKGKGIPSQIRIRGSYRSHNNIPAPLKDLSGVRIYLLKQNASKDTDVLATAPWSAELEAKLRKTVASAP